MKKLPVSPSPPPPPPGIGFVRFGHRTPMVEYGDHQMITRKRDGLSAFKGLLVNPFSPDWPLERVSRSKAFLYLLHILPMQLTFPRPSSPTVKDPRQTLITSHNSEQHRRHRGKRIGKGLV